MLDANQPQGFETLTLTNSKNNITSSSEVFQDSHTMKWEPWPEAHVEEAREHLVNEHQKYGNQRDARAFHLESEAEAGECWRSAVKCFPRADVEREAP